MASINLGLLQFGTASTIAPDLTGSGDEYERAVQRRRRKGQRRILNVHVFFAESLWNVGGSPGFWLNAAHLEKRCAARWNASVRCWSKAGLAGTYASTLLLACGESRQAGRALDVIDKMRDKSLRKLATAKCQRVGRSLTNSWTPHGWDQETCSRSRLETKAITWPPMAWLSHGVKRGSSRSYPSVYACTRV